MSVRALLVAMLIMPPAWAGAQAVFPPANDAPREKPPAPPARWRGLLGEYGVDSTTACTLENHRDLLVLENWRDSLRLRERSDHRFTVASGADSAMPVVFRVGTGGRAVEMRLADTVLPRRAIEPLPGTNQLRIKPVRPVEELRREALASEPPHENGQFRTPDLVELTKLDPTIKLQIRYATTNNFLGTRIYEQARAFLQRPAAEAVVRANAALRPLGYGLLIHDAYRPWYVTKIFWDATPADLKWMVANPAEGSRHNRGAAVDLTLYDRRTGKAVEMPSTYDESTHRAFAFYPCGTSLQRWYRALLRRTMEQQGFTVNPQEWWHFDYRDWRQYPIGNTPFEKLGVGR